MLNRRQFKTFVKELNDQKKAVNEEWNTFGAGDIQVMKLDHVNYCIKEILNVYQEHIYFLETLDKKGKN